MTFPLDCKFQIVGLQSNPSVSTAWRDSPTKNGFAWQDFQTSPWKKPFIAYNTLLGLFSDTYALRNSSNIRFLPMFARVFVFYRKWDLASGSFWMAGWSFLEDWWSAGRPFFLHFPTPSRRSTFSRATWRRINSIASLYRYKSWTHGIRLHWRLRNYG